MPPEFRFRLNGQIMPELFVQRALVHGEPIGEWEIAVDTRTSEFVSLAIRHRSSNINAE
jgi:hypothetical protein